MSIIAAAASGSGSAGGAAGGTAAGTAEGASAGSAATGASAASNFGLVGGALDSLGVSVTGWIDRFQKAKAAEQDQANFDKQFDENLRRWGLEFALRDWSTRKGVAIQEAQSQWERSSGSLSLQNQLRTSQQTQQANQIDLNAKIDRQRIGRLFAKGFAQGTTSKVGI